MRRGPAATQSAHPNEAIQLAEAGRSLAAAAKVLAQGDRAGSVAAAAVEHLDDAATILGRAGPDEPEVDPVEHALSRLHQALRQLAGSPPTSVSNSSNHPPLRVDQVASATSATDQGI
ncbi:MAG: hypothetical protein DLM54_01360 [Acidimicrobiales bacterium]|nr:MAG: hypothetical protein DLM54_01360 [Acidimicrobiales bacterium]